MACLPPPKEPLPRLPAAVPASARNGGTVKQADVPPERRLSPQHRHPHARDALAGLRSDVRCCGHHARLMPGRLYRCDCTRCLNLLLTYPEGCRANCAYCGLARHREADRNYADRNFIRVDWPAAPLTVVIERVAEAGDATPFHRMCISMITHPRSDADAKTVLERWVERMPREVVPVSILSNPTTLNHSDVAGLLALGADIFTVALDACNPTVFARTRGKGVAEPAFLGTLLGSIRPRRRVVRTGPYRDASRRRAW